MKSAVVLLPGLNRDRDMIAALTKISGRHATPGRLLADRRMTACRASNRAAAQIVANELPDGD